jgi:AAA family ATP:ADP antiporter
MQIDELSKVLWLSITVFFIVGGYWLLRSLKDPIMSVINGVEYIPQAKIVSLFVVFGLV